LGDTGIGISSDDPGQHGLRVPAGQLTLLTVTGSKPASLESR